MKKNNVQCAAPSSAIYGLGLVGAFIYYMSNASGVGDVLFGIVKALLWPGFVVYELMDFLGM